MNFDFDERAKGIITKWIVDPYKMGRPKGLEINRYEVFLIAEALRTAYIEGLTKAKEIAESHYRRWSIVEPVSTIAEKIQSEINKLKEEK